jgi:hypothetical protein
MKHYYDRDGKSWNLKCAAAHKLRNRALRIYGKRASFSSTPGILTVLALS